MVSTARTSILVLFSTLFGFSRAALAGPVEDCLATTGLAHVISDSSLIAGAQWTYVFGGPAAFVSCDPPDIQSADFGAGASAAAASYAAGVGSFLATGALSSPSSSSGSTGYLDLELLYSFEVVPDDPNSTDPVTIEIVGRHRYGSAIADSSGGGSASNQQFTYYELRQTLNGVYVGPTWTNDFPVVSGDFLDVHHTVEVPVNVSLNLLAEIRQRSDSNPGGGGGSGAATLNAMWTFEVTTSEAATISFDFEEHLGLAPPQLDYVPEPGGVLPGLIGIGALIGLDRRRRSL